MSDEGFQKPEFTVVPGAPWALVMSVRNEDDQQDHAVALYESKEQALDELNQATGGGMPDVVRDMLLDCNEPQMDFGFRCYTITQVVSIIRRNQ
jgi:CheY-like chemotaxis protein